MSSEARTTHRGVHWYRDTLGNVYFYDQGGEKWVRWEAGADTPPLPPKWQMLGVPTRVTRPGWRSPWRLIPAALVLAAVVYAVLQAVLPSGDQVAKEARASAALLGRCLPHNGHGGLSAKPVPCGSTSAAVKVVAVVPSSPGSPGCPTGTTATYLPYSGVRYLHIECVKPVTHPG